MILYNDQRVDFYAGEEDVSMIRIGDDLVHISPEELDTWEEAGELLYWDAKYYTWGEFGE